MKRIASLCLAFILLFTSAAVYTPAAPAEAANVLSKLVAFTFDDGPSDYTPQLLDGLKSIGAKATFFVNGENGSYLGAKNHMTTIRRMVKEGHQVANHTYSHYVPFDALSASSVQSQVSWVNSYLYKAVGAPYQSLVRTPGGALSSTIRNNVDAPIILWSVDTMDWHSRNANAVYNAIMNNVKDGSIVLLHDIYSTSVSGALKAMRALRNEGYVFVTVSELFRRRGISLKNGQVYTDAPNNGTTLPAYRAPRVTTVLNYKTRKKTLTLSATDKGVSLYYTTDGSFPTMGAKKYTAPFEVSYDQTVYVVGYDKHGVRTPIITSDPANDYLGVFDPIYYGNRYPEIQEQCKNDDNKLLEHFLKTGLASGLQGSPVFDLQYYVKKYPELQQRFGADIQKYVDHFMGYGMQKGLRGCKEFDVNSYRLSYPDLRKKYGNDLKSYYLHFIRYGHREGRIAFGRTKMVGYTTVYNGVNYASVYDYNVYTARYPYIKDNYKYNDAGVLKHFVQSGLKHGHRAHDDFNVHKYRSRYKDLQKAFGNNLPAYYTHYIKHGRKEGRIGN